MYPFTIDLFTDRKLCFQKAFVLACGTVIFITRWVHIKKLIDDVMIKI